MVLGLMAGSLAYFATVNPGMKYGGLLGTPKWDILRHLPKTFLPKTIIVEPNEHFERILQRLEQEDIAFPLIAKPNFGERGWRVRLIQTPDALQAYLQGFDEPTLLQEFVDWPWEFGILYYRYPNGQFGISSITYKGFMKVRGDGQQTIRQLLAAEPRYRLQLARLETALSQDIHRILPQGEELLLEAIGNHNRGTTFLNGQQYHSEALTELMHQIAAHIPDFFYGRFDLKAKSPDDLTTGQHIKILEINGVQSEPAHIYDPSYRLLRAYRDIIAHMLIIWRISRANHAQGVPYPPFAKLLADIRAYLIRKKRKDKKA